MLAEKRTELSTQANKLRSGLSKIDSSRDTVEEMSADLEIASAKVIEFQHQCDEYMVIIVHQTQEADEQQVCS